MLFKDLGLLPELEKAIIDSGYTAPTPIQNQVIPLIMEGKDILASAQTGTGKTAGFTLPMLHRLASSNKKGYSGVRALILAPTRELAAQVAEDVKRLSKHLPLKSTAVFGGVGIFPQIKSLRKGVDILVATPGRLLDHVDQKTVDLSKVEILILDEADRMLDMGFIHDIRHVISLLPKQKQVLLFSATFSKEVRKLADGLLTDPLVIEAPRTNPAADTVSHIIHPVDRHKKSQLLSFLIKKENWKQVLVFTRTKHMANRLSTELENEGISSTAIHSNKTQAARMKALGDFKRGSVRALVATDVASRGIDIDHLPNVVNYDLPEVPDDYVHRIGRTGRAGKEGQATSLVCIDDQHLLRQIEKALKKDLPKVTVTGFEPDLSIKAAPVMNRGRFGRGGGASKSRSGERRRFR